MSNTKGCCWWRFFVLVGLLITVPPLGVLYLFYLGSKP